MMRWMLIAALGFGSVCCTTLAPGLGDLAVEPFGRMANGERVFVYTMHQGAITARVTNFGATLISVDVPDREGGTRRVLDGFEGVLDYEQATDTRPGGVVHFFDGDGHLGDPLDPPLGQRVWEVLDQGRAGDLAFLRLGLDYATQERGEPVDLRAEVTFTLDEAGELAIQYENSTTGEVRPSMCHALVWNLAGWGAPGEDAHELRVHAERRFVAGGMNLKSDRWTPVAGSHFDFRSGRSLGSEGSEGLSASSYEVTFALDPRMEGSGLSKLCHGARLACPSSGCALDLWTDQPHLTLLSEAQARPAAGSQFGVELRPQCIDAPLTPAQRKRLAGKVSTRRSAWRFFTLPSSDS